MKRTSLASLCVGLFCAVVSSGPSGSAQTAGPAAATQVGGCKASTLKGYYVYAQSGFTISGTQATQRIPFAQAGREFYDGAGSVSGDYTASQNGKVTRGHYAGTYQIGANCAGMVTFKDNLGHSFHYDVFANEGGDEFSFIQTDSDVVSAAYERRRALPKE